VIATEIYASRKAEGRGGAVCKAAVRVQGTPWQKDEKKNEKISYFILHTSSLI